MAQPFSIGTIGGVPLTGGLQNTTTQEVDLITHSFSDSNLYVVGAMVELRLPFGLAVEADGLYHPINCSETIQVVPSGSGHHSVGGGVELKISKLRIAPELRYTHWGSDGVPPPDVGSFPPSQQNQGEFLVGFSF